MTSAADWVSSGQDYTICEESGETKLSLAITTFHPSSEQEVIAQLFSYKEGRRYMYQEVV